MDTSRWDAGSRRGLAWIEIVFFLLPVCALWTTFAPGLAVKGCHDLERFVRPEAFVSEFEESEFGEVDTQLIRMPAQVLASEIARTRRDGAAGMSLLGLAVGGLAGWPALWRLVLPVALGRDGPRRLGRWRGLGLLLGSAACIWFLATMHEALNIRNEATLAWVGIAGIPMLVALHQVADVLSRRQMVDAAGKVAA